MQKTPAMDAFHCGSHNDPRETHRSMRKACRSAEPIPESDSGGTEEKRGKGTILFAYLKKK